MAAFAWVASLCLSLQLASVGQAQETTNRPTIAVLDFTNGSLMNHADYQPLSVGLMGFLMTELGSNPRVVVVERERIRALLDEQDLRKGGRVDGATAARIGKILGAQYVITGGFLIDRRETMRIDARAVNVETSVITHAETVTGTTNDVLGLIDKLAQQLNAGLRLPAYAGRRARESGEGTASAPTAATARRSKPADWRTLVATATAMEAEDNGNAAEAKRIYEMVDQQMAVGVEPELRQQIKQRIALLTRK